MIFSEREIQNGTYYLVLYISSHIFHFKGQIFRDRPQVSAKYCYFGVFLEANLCFGYMYDLVLYVKAINLGNLQLILKNMHTTNLISSTTRNFLTFWY